MGRQSSKRREKSTVEKYRKQQCHTGWLFKVYDHEFKIKPWQPSCVFFLQEYSSAACWQGDDKCQIQSVRVVPEMSNKEKN